MKLLTIGLLSAFSINSLAAVNDSEKKIAQEAVNQHYNVQLSLEQSIGDSFGSTIKKVGKKVVSGVKKIFKALSPKDAQEINAIISEAENNSKTLTEEEKRNSIYLTNENVKVLKEISSRDKRRDARVFTEEEIKALNDEISKQNENSNKPKPTRSNIKLTREERNALVITPEQAKMINNILSGDKRDVIYIK